MSSSGGGMSTGGKWISAIVGATIAVGAVALTVLTTGSSGAAAPPPPKDDKKSKPKPIPLNAAGGAAGLPVAQQIASKPATGAAAGGGGASVVAVVPHHRPAKSAIAAADPLLPLLVRLHSSVSDRKSAPASGVVSAGDHKSIVSGSGGLGSRLPSDKARFIAKGFFASEYQNVSLTTKRFNVSVPVLYTICYRYLRVPDVCTLRAVNRAWAQFASVTLANRSYLHHHATVGFEDGKDGRRRGHVWTVVSGAENTLRHVRSVEKTDPTLKGRTLYMELLARKGKSFHDVEKDVDRTLIHHCSFIDEKAAEKALQNVLNAYSIHDVAVGYTQGMNFLAAFVLTKLKEEEAYWTWYTIMNSPRYDFREYFFPDLQGVLIAKYQFRYLFEAFLPDLNSHFLANDVPGDAFTEWFMTLFTFRKFPRATAARVWDLMLVDGPKTLFRVALAILFLAQDYLLASDFEGIFTWAKTLPDPAPLNENAVIKTALTFQVTNSLLDRLAAQYWRQFQE